MDQWQENVEQDRRRREVIEDLATLIQAEEDAERNALE